MWNSEQRASRVGQILKQARAEGLDTAYWEMRAERHANECGCAMSAGFFLLSFMATVAVTIGLRQPILTVVFSAIVVSFIMAGAGKIVGLTLAQARLAGIGRTAAMALGRRQTAPVDLTFLQRIG